MKLEKELKELQVELNEELTYYAVVPIVDYVCKFCGATYGESEQAFEHTKDCIRNLYENKSCVTCKHSCYNLMPTYGKRNGYEVLVDKMITSGWGYFTCEKENKIYEGKLSEEKILTKDKGCFEPLEEGQNFLVNRTDEYEEYMKILETATIEQDKIDGDISEFWQKVKDLDEQGYTNDEIIEVLEKEYDED